MTKRLINKRPVKCGKTVDINFAAYYRYYIVSVLRVVFVEGTRGGDMSWSLNFEVLREMAYFVLMFCSHTIVSPSLTSTYKYHPECAPK